MTIITTSRPHPGSVNPTCFLDCFFGVSLSIQQYIFKLPCGRAPRSIQPGWLFATILSISDHRGRISLKLNISSKIFKWRFMRIFLPIGVLAFLYSFILSGAPGIDVSFLCLSTLYCYDLCIFSVLGPLFILIRNESSWTLKLIAFVPRCSERTCVMIIC